MFVAIYEDEAGVIHYRDRDAPPRKPNQSGRVPGSVTFCGRPTVNLHQKYARWFPADRVVRLHVHRYSCVGCLARMKT